MNAELIRTLEQVQARILTSRPEIAASHYQRPVDDFKDARWIGASQIADHQPAAPKERAA